MTKLAIIIAASAMTLPLAASPAHAAELPRAPLGAPATFAWIEASSLPVS